MKHKTKENWSLLISTGIIIFVLLVLFLPMTLTAHAATGSGEILSEVDTISTYYFPEKEVYEFIHVTRPISFEKSQGEVTQHLLSEHLFLKHSNELFPKTTITDSEGKIYTGSLLPPYGQTSFEQPRGNYTAVQAVEFGIADTTLFLSDESEIMLKVLPQNTEKMETLFLYFYNQSNRTYELVDGTRVLFDRDFFEANVQRLGTYVLIDVGYRKPPEVLELPAAPYKTAIRETLEVEANTGPTDIYGHWGEKYIKEAIENEYMSGYEDGTFLPEQAINRAEASKILALWKGGEGELPTCEDALFADVPCAQWFAPYVQLLTEAKIISGYEGGIFSPEKELNRAEALKLLILAGGLENTPVSNFFESPFTDVVTTEWYYPYVLIAHQKGLVKGYADGSFGGKNPITRAEFTKLFVEILLN